jgi:hypothetical protein
MGFAKAAVLQQDDAIRGRGTLEVYLDELHAGLHDAEDHVAQISSKARLDALIVRSWTIVEREFPGTVVQRLGRTSQLLYLWVASMVRVPISPADREELIEGFHELVFTWVLENRDGTLTRRETQELRQYWARRQTTALSSAAAGKATRDRRRRRETPASRVTRAR